MLVISSILLDLVIKNYDFGNIEVVFHQGACSSTTEWDGKYLMKNNYEYSKILLNWCQKINSQFIHASSASVYGLGNKGFKEKILNEKPINAYAYSKFFFDQYIRKFRKDLKSQVVSLRYFNVYGPRQDYRRSIPPLMSSIIINLLKKEKPKIYGDGSKRRDFIYVDDVNRFHEILLTNKC